MTRRLTRITLPGQKDFSGLMDWGEKAPEEMVAQARTYAAGLRTAAEAIERAADAEFKVDLVEGSAVQRLVRTLQQPKEK